MKRFLVLLSALFICGMLTGCPSDPRGDAVSSVVDLMNSAAQDVGGITKEVDKAIEKSKKDNAALDLSDAIKAAKSLEEKGKALQKVKTEQVDRVKPANDDEKAEFANQFKVRINNALTDLVKSKSALNDALKRAEDVAGDAKVQVDELRVKIREAEGPFEALARQQG
jgi:hypothetical protein